MKALQIIESAYRCTLEEQDDPILWIAHAMKGAGADLGVLLRGNAVNYAVRAQDASGLRIGDREYPNPPNLESAVEGLVAKGVPVHFVTDDAELRGIRPADFIEGVQALPRSALPQLFADYDQLWHW